MEQLLSVTDFAKRLGGISPWTVRAWCSQGRIERTKVGRRTMIAESELHRVVRDSAKAAASKKAGARNAR
jgi:excisionase family DNA binding protein